MCYELSSTKMIRKFTNVLLKYPESILGNADHRITPTSWMWVVVFSLVGWKLVLNLAQYLKAVRLTPKRCGKPHVCWMSVFNTYVTVVTRIFPTQFSVLKNLARTWLTQTAASLLVHNCSSMSCLTSKCTYIVCIWLKLTLLGMYLVTCVYLDNFFR